MSYLIDVGSSTVKVYKRKESNISLVQAKTFDFKTGFTSEKGLSEENRKLFYDFFAEITSCFKLNNGNTKIFATGIFRDIADKQGFVSEFYIRTHLYFNIVSHDLEAFYLEKAWVGKCNNDSVLLVINIGGKTTELVWYIGNEVIEKVKMDIGVGTILKKFNLINETYSAHAISEIVEYIRMQLPMKNRVVDAAIYTGGELKYMQVAKYPLIDNNIFYDKKHPAMIYTHEYISYNKRIFEEISITALRNMMPENTAWMNGARACSALAQAICQHYGVPVIIPSNSNMVDGVNIQEATSVTVCGSFNKHLDRISKLISSLEDRGIQVLSPKNTQVIGSEDDFLLFKNDVIVNHCTFSVEMLHLQAIEASDMVIICNYDGYIGIKTAVEIGYALKCGKKIVFIEENITVHDLDLPSEVNLL